MDKLKLIIILLLLTSSIYSQTIKGKIYDKETKQALAFASVYVSKENKGTITNEDGYFEINLKENNPTITIYYLGYNTKTIKNYSDTVIYLEKTKYIISEIDVVAYTSEKIADMIIEIREKAQKKRDIYIDSKALIKTYTQRNDSLVELKEALYSIEQNITGIKEANIKNGRIAFLRNKKFYSLDITNYMKRISLFSLNKNKSLNVESPLIYSFSKPILDNYKLDFNQINDSIACITFLAKNNKSKGKIFFEKNNYSLKKIVISLYYDDNMPFKSINPNKKEINQNLNFVVNFKKQNNISVINLLSLNIIEQFKYKNFTDTIKTNYIIHFFDYYKPYPIPFYGIKRDFNDYEGIIMCSYQQNLWENISLKLTSSEKNFLGKNIMKNKDIHNFKYIAVQSTKDTSKINWNLLKYNKKNDFKIDISLFCDFYNINDTNYFKVTGIFDYYNSYFTFQINQSAYNFIKEIFKIANNNSKELENKLINKFRNKSNLSSLEIKKELAIQIRKFQKQKRNYIKKNIKFLTEK